MIIKKINAHYLTNHFNKNSFDIIFASHSLEHMIGLTLVLKQIREVAKMGVYIVLPLSAKRNYQHPNVFNIHGCLVYSLGDYPATVEELNNKSVLLKEFSMWENFNLVYFQVCKNNGQIYTNLRMNS